VKLSKQFEIACAVEEYNLASGQSVDPERVIRERIAERRSLRQSAQPSVSDFDFGKQMTTTNLVRGRASEGAPASSSVAA
jgi:hypothetical protein